MVVWVLTVVLGYLWGSIPSGYLVARYLRGIDIRRYGSGNVGATNVMSHVGFKTGFLLGTFDCLGKGTLPVVVAGLLGMGPGLQAAAGLAALAGHNWSPFIRFTGGRGVATAIGVVFGFALFWEFLILGFVLGFIGRFLLKDTGFWTFVSMLALPPLTFVFGRPPEVVYMSLVMAGLLMAKRLTANWEPLDGRYPAAQVLLFRLLWDRDVPRKEQWLERHPRREEGPSQDVPDKLLP